MNGVTGSNTRATNYANRAFLMYIPPIYAGYIGGAVLNLLLERPDISSYSITVLVRSPEKAQKLREIGVNAVVGSLQDLDIVENLAADADIVIALVSRAAKPIAIAD